MYSLFSFVGERGRVRSGIAWFREESSNGGRSCAKQKRRPMIQKEQTNLIG